MRPVLRCSVGKARLILSLTQEFEATPGVGQGLWLSGSSQTFPVSQLLSQSDLSVCQPAPLGPPALEDVPVLLGELEREVGWNLHL